MCVDMNGGRIASEHTHIAHCKWPISNSSNITIFTFTIMPPEWDILYII